MNDYSNQRKWADFYIPQILDILKPHVGEMVSIVMPTEEQDTKQATDLVIRMDVGTIATRVRKPHNGDRDLTIRTQATYGGKTEISKIKDGFARWYFYGWVDGDKIAEWMIVDLDFLREANVWDKYDDIPNGDGTWFIAIPFDDLKKLDCIVSSQILNH